MKRLRVAVIGAGGRVGSALVAALSARRDVDVVAIVRNALTGRLLNTATADIRVGSVTDPSSSQALLADCDGVVNCALAKGWPLTARRQNEAIIRNIASAPRLRVAVHFSTVAVYGPCVDPRFNSFERPRPDSSYGIDKLSLERLATRLFSARGIRHYIVRLGHVYGPSQWVSRDILERSKDLSFALPFGGRIPSNAVSIEAVIAAVRNMLTEVQPSGIRNLVDSPQSTWRELFDSHTDLLDRAPVESLSELASHELRERYYASARRAGRTLVRAGLAALGSIDLISLAKLEVFRRIVHGPLLLFPASLEAAVNRKYVRRKVRGAIRHSVPGVGLPPAVMCAPAVPGPCFDTIAAAEAMSRMRDELRDWLLGLSTYRWDPADLNAGTPSADGRVASTAARGDERITEMTPAKPIGHLARSGMVQLASKASR